MRVIVTIDGDLLVPQNPNIGIIGQREEVNRVIAALGDLLKSPNEIIIIHGNAPQVGYVLLRAEIASHVVHSLPLDICEADTQGATGYLLQQAIRNWLDSNQFKKEVASLVTQVVVDPAQPAKIRAERGVGPYFDQEKAQTYRSARGWNFVLVPGRGYRRAVPALTPKGIPEINLIRQLLAPQTILICAGGGGIAVTKNDAGQLLGVEAVVNKSATTALMARELQADGIIFVTLWDKVKYYFGITPGNRLQELTFSELDAIVDRSFNMEDENYHKFLAAKECLEAGGKWVLFSPPEGIQANIERSHGVLFRKDK